MCTLAFYFQVFSHYPIVAAANRDESLNRPSAPPLRLWNAPWIYGGQDLLAGGTWLGINEYGMIAALLNRHTGAVADPSRRSRGLLCLDALKYPSIADALTYVTSQSTREYNPFNLLIADHASAYVLYAEEKGFEVVSLTPGFHLLTNRNLNDQQCPRIARSLHNFSQVSNIVSPCVSDASDIFTHLHPLLAHHTADLDPRASVCIHLDGYGTCSSTLLAYSVAEERYKYTFAPGSPCRHTYSELLPPGTLANHPPSTI
jgi:uncharacterized protein with NRDE domain